MSNDNTAKPTAGQWRQDPTDMTCVITEALGVGDIVCLSPSEGGFSESAKNWEANAALIIEAGTAYHETGLTPRQLQLERINLIVALHNIADIEDELDGSDWSEISHARDIARAAIAKCEAKP